ncbi:MAG: U32 family peptidase [Lachnospiraceae bacterium]|nr:U32 family peptidase [Lachnospiraceae bacterium]
MSKLGLEVLAPAGSPEIFTRVIDAGADAVYFGGHAFGARAYATNFTIEAAEASIRYAHARGKKAYLTVNTLLKNLEIERELYPYLKSYYEMGLDAAIVQDYGVFTMIRDCFPDLALHCSTQMSLSTPYGASFLQKQGAHRIVTAREISVDEISKIYDATGIEIETFVHGALCVCYSGQCLMSSMIGGRSGNRGRCAQPCRLPYDVLDASHHQLATPGKYVISPKDLCGIQDIPRLSEAGVYSLKIEGRMKQGDYAEGVVAMYRKYVDRYLFDGAKGYQVDPEDMDILMGLGNRNGFTRSYYVERNASDLISYTDSSHHNQKAPSAPERKIKHQLPIRGQFVAKLGEPMSLRISSMDGNKVVSVTSEVPQVAQNAGATEDSIRQKLTKTGNSPYQFADLEILCGDGLFLAGSLLNDLRRRGLEAFESFMLERPRTEATPWEPSQWSDDSVALDNGCFVTVRDEKQLFCVLDKEYVTYVGLDTSITLQKDMDVSRLVQQIHKHGHKAVFMMPMIFRINCEKRLLALFEQGLGFDYYMATTMDALGFLMEHVEPGKIILDQRLYSYSNVTLMAYQQLGIGITTIPYELNAKELKHRKNGGSFLTIYGYTPLMYMANCTHKNCMGCDHKPAQMYLRDRYGNDFPLMNACEICTNVLYNCLPTSLIGETDAKQLPVLGHRLDFTIESEEEVHQILEQYEKGSREGNEASFTKGHFRRGVE